MKKKICPRPQCAKEYLEGEGFEEFTVCSICGAPLEEILVEDYNIEEVTSENDENVEYETEDIIEENIDNENPEEVTIDSNNEDSEVFFDTDVLVDVNVEKENSEEGINSDEASEESNIYNGIKGDNLIIYKGNEVFKVYELKYDEIVIGRNSSEFTPDIDLQEIDNGNAISRKHLLVYREDGKYYIRNLSKKCSVHLRKYNEEVPKEVPFNLSVIIEDGDFIVLSGKFILEAFLGEVEE